jgi:signal transduction histidine kinase
MDEFDALKNSWHKQKLAKDSHKEIELLKEKAIGQAEAWRKKQLWTNLGMTASFAVVFGVIYWVWTSFIGQPSSFYFGMGIMAVLLLVFLGIQWYSYQPDWGNLDENPKMQIKKRKQKLQMNKWILTKGMPIYFTVLLMAFYIYYFGLFQGASWEYWALSYVLTTVYFGVMAWFARLKVKKQVQRLEELEAYLHEWEEMI